MSIFPYIFFFLEKLTVTTSIPWYSSAEPLNGAKDSRWIQGNQTRSEEEPAIVRQEEII